MKKMTTTTRARRRVAGRKRIRVVRLEESVYDTLDLPVPSIAAVEGMKIFRVDYSCCLFFSPVTCSLVTCSLVCLDES